MQAADTKTQVSFEKFCKNLPREVTRVLGDSGFTHADFECKTEKQYGKDVILVADAQRLTPGHHRKVPKRRSCSRRQSTQTGAQRCLQICRIRGCMI